MYIAPGGNVGIGTTAPASILNTSGSSQGITHDDSATGKGYLRFRNSGTQVSLFGVAGAWEGSSLQDTMIAAETGLNIRFYTNGSGTPKMYISGSGNVGIGTTSPDRGLTINRTNELASLNIIKNNTGNQIVYLGTGAGGADDLGILQLSDVGAVKVQIYTGGNSWFNGGNVGIGTNSPAAKLHIKESVASTSQIRMSAASNEANYGYLTMTDNTFNTAKLTLGTTYGYNTPVDTLTIFNRNVGIGTTNPGTLLQVSPGSSYAADPTIQVVTSYPDGYDAILSLNNTHTGGRNWFMRSTNDSQGDFGGGKLVFQDRTAGASTAVMTLVTGGNVGIGTTSPTYNLHVSGAIAIEAESTTTKYSTTFSGTLSSNTNIAFVPTGSFKAAFFDYYVASSSTNMRAGTIMAVQNNSTSRYTDTSTGDIGNTSAVDFTTSVVGGNLVLTANISSGTWEIKTAYRAL
jgi:hypothetical protein